MDSWSPWSQCSKSCLGTDNVKGTQTRLRKCNNALNGGISCQQLNKDNVRSNILLNSCLVSTISKLLKGLSMTEYCRKTIQIQAKQKHIPKIVLETMEHHLLCVQQIFHGQVGLHGLNALQPVAWMLLGHVTGFAMKESLVDYNVNNFINMIQSPVILRLDIQIRSMMYFLLKNSSR